MSAEERPGGTGPAIAALPAPVNALWQELQAVRGELLREVQGLSQAQADWPPSPGEWSVGEILHHLLLAEIHTGKLTTKLIREAEALAGLRPFPADLDRFAALPPQRPEGAEAPPLVWPRPGQRLDGLLAEMRTARRRTFSSLQKLATVDPRDLTATHFAFGTLDLAQWWMLQASHDRQHLQQVRAVKSARGFPRAGNAIGPRHARTSRDAR